MRQAKQIKKNKRGKFLMLVTKRLKKANKAHRALMAALPHSRKRYKAEWEEESKYSYIPIAVTCKKLVPETQDGNGAPNVELISVVSEKIVLKAWEFTKEIYTFSEELDAELDKTITSSTKVNMDFLDKLPQWCIAIESKVFANSDGFLVYRDIGRDRKPCFVLVIYNRTGALTFLPFIIKEGETVHEALDGLGLNTSLLSARIQDDNLSGNPSLDLSVDQVENEMCRALSRIIYLVSEEPDITSHQPARKSLSRKGSNLTDSDTFKVPDKPKTFAVGNVIAETLRKFNAQKLSGMQGERGSYAPHIRAAHWHGYWSGKRDATKRMYRVRWLAPIFVNSTEE